MAPSREPVPPRAPEDPSARRTIPFDYAFRFDLSGEPGKTHNQSLSVSIEASFTAVSIGYGVIPKTTPLNFGLLPRELAEGATGNAQKPVVDLVNALAPSFSAIIPKQIFTTTPGGGVATAGSRTAIRQFAQRSFLRLTLAALGSALDEPIDQAAASPVIGPQTAAALRNGIKFNPEFVERLLLSLDGDELDDASFLEAFQVVAAPLDRIQFKYALFDGGSGREFQSEPLLSTAGLGSPDGRRPFRYFARPIEFSPRSNIRLQVTEVSDFTGELHVSLQGYKTLGGTGTPTAVNPPPPRQRRLRR
jgi:hypothetical protein